MTPADLLDVVIDKARKLREAGVLRVRIEGLAFDLAPPPQILVEDEAGDEELEEFEDPNPLNDPTTFGGQVPGFKRRPHEEHGR